ncbi:hypothetical protein OR1_02716 [Geobacter sp. OR-1]|nr:hypothetical protein OR1_02716 [Geobacter sp. OR-1]
MKFLYIFMTLLSITELDYRSQEGVHESFIPFTEYEAENCIVKFFASKRQIVFDNGESLNKMQGKNLKIYLDGQEIE